MSGSQSFDVTRFIDEQPFRRLHWLIIVVSFLLMVVDGYDIVCVAYVAPVLRVEWGFPPASLGLLFGAAPLGAAIGPVLVGRVADKVGRKPTLAVGTVGFGVFTLASVLAESLTQMVALRFVAGVGIGVVVSVAIAYISEFAPRRLRGTMIIFGVVGVALGGGLAGLVAAQLLPHYSWRSIFWVGGVTPILLTLVGYWATPESPKFLALVPRRRAELVSVLRRLGAPADLSSSTELTLSGEPRTDRFALKAVFSGPLAAIVPLLMATTFFAQFALFFVNQWTTILLTSSGVPVGRAAYATAAFQIAGFLGAVLVSRPVDWYGFLPVPFLFVGAAIVIGLMGIPGQTETTLTFLAGLAGFCVIGLQFGNIASIGQVFPTSVRSLGVGVCYGCGRFGSVVGPAIAGGLVALGFSVSDLFYFSGAAMLVGAVAGAILVPLYARQVSRMQAQSGREPPRSRGGSAVI